MYEIFDADPAVMAAEQAYRRAHLIDLRSPRVAPRARWWRRRNPRTD